MKRLLLLFCLLLCSCEQDTDICDCGPYPKFLRFSEGGSFLLDWQGGLDSTFVLNSNYWWFEESDYATSQQNCIFFKPVEEPDYCDDNYCNEDKNQAIKIECPWSSIVKKNDSTIIVSVKQNDTEKRRYISIPVGGHHIETSEYISGYIFIDQCPEPIDDLFSKENLSFNVEGGVDTVIVNVDIELHPWISHNLGPREDPGFTMKIAENKIIISVSKNEAGRPRKYSITFDERCEEEIKVTQSAE